MKPLYLADLAGMDKRQLHAHILDSYAPVEGGLKDTHVLLAYESVGAWGCDSSSFFIIRSKSTRQLYTVNGSHCSCYGFEGQWTPILVTAAQLKAEPDPMFTGGYDDNASEHKQAVRDFIKRLR